MKYLYLILLLSSACLAYGQKQNVYFLQNDGTLVSTKDSADYIRIVREPDAGSKLYNILEFYPQGQKKLLGKSSKIDPVRLEGICLTFYPNGTRERVATYKNNKVIGTAYTYFPNGKLYTVKEFCPPDSTKKYKVALSQTVLIKTCNDSTGKVLVANGNGHYIGYAAGFKYIFEEGDVQDGKKTGEWKGRYDKLTFTEIYRDGALIEGKSADSAGVYNYHERLTLPQYKGGVDNFYRMLAQNIRYTVADRENGVQGIVLINFVVTKDGKINNVKLIRSASRYMDAEAMRVVSLSKEWLPAVSYGRQVDYPFTVPISFTLRDGPRF